MGLCFSGEIADLVFNRLSETRFLEASRHLLVSYDRFKDDIITVFRGSREACKLWIRHFEILCQNVFRLKLEEIDETKADLLDFSTFKGPRWHRSKNLGSIQFPQSLSFMGRGSTLRRVFNFSSLTRFLYAARDWERVSRGVLFITTGPYGLRL